MPTDEPEESWSDITLRRCEDVGWRCEGCGKRRALAGHHWLPKGRSGRPINDYYNCVVACVYCHVPKIHAYEDGFRHLIAPRGAWETYLRLGRDMRATRGHFRGETDAKASSSDADADV